MPLTRRHRTLVPLPAVAVPAAGRVPHHHPVRLLHLAEGLVRSSILSTELPLTSDNVYSEIQRDLVRPVLIASMMANDTFLHDWIKHGEQNPEQITRYLREVQNTPQRLLQFLRLGKRPAPTSRAAASSSRWPRMSHGMPGISASAS